MMVPVLSAGAYRQTGRQYSSYTRTTTAGRDKKICATLEQGNRKTRDKVASALIDQETGALTLLGLQSRFGDKPLKFQVLFPKIGTVILKELRKIQSTNSWYRTR